MPTITRAVKTRSLKYALIPIAAITLCLSAMLTVLYIIQLEEFAKERGYHVSRLLSQLTYQSMHNRLLLQSVVHTAVTDGDIVAVRVYDLNRNPIIHSGPRFSEVFQLDPNQFGLDPQHQVERKSSLFTVPIHADHDTFAPFGWLVVEIASDDYTLLQYKTLLIALLLGAIVAAASAWISLTFSRDLAEGLRLVKQGMAQLRKGQLDTRVNADQFIEFDDLAVAFNQLAEGLKQQQEDIQRNMDQSIEDLRETLETIEIQNIELDLARKEAVEASRVKSDFLANTSHEIRTPLNGIIGFTSLLLKTQVSDQQREYLRTIQHSSQGLLTIINDVLDFSKIESGRLQLDYIPMQLRQVIEESMQIMAPAAHEKGLQLILHVDPELPPHLLGDPLRMKQVMTNLISNAIKFSSGGNIEVTASLKTQSETQVEVNIHVKDSGEGIPESDRKKLFQAFSQLDTSNSRKHGGTGLGLAVSKGLVKRMKGEIGVESNAEGGSLFWFTATFGVDTQENNENQQHLLEGSHFVVLTGNPPLAHQLQEIVGSERGKLQIMTGIPELIGMVKNHMQNNQPIEAVFYDIDPQQEKLLDLHNLRELVDQLMRFYACKTIFMCTPSARRQLEHHLTPDAQEYLEKPVTLNRTLHLLRKELAPLKEETSIGRNNSPYENKPRILAVDDNPANLQLVGELLNGLGAEVALASDGKQAIEQAENKLFDMIFMDLQMPIMDGLEATKIIRSRESGKRRTPIVALTAHAMAEQKSQLLLAGMDDYLSKPVSEAQLAHIINRWLRTRKHLPHIAEKADSEPPLQDTATRVVDIQQSLKLANGKPGLAKDMLSMLLANLPADSAKIRNSADSSDFATLEATVHRLHGGCCYCGVGRLKTAAQALDKALQNKDHSQLPSQLDSLYTEIDALLAWSREHDLDALFETDNRTDKAGITD